MVFWGVFSGNFSKTVFSEWGRKKMYIRELKISTTSDRSTTTIRDLTILAFAILIKNPVKPAWLRGFCVPYFFVDDCGTLRRTVLCGRDWGLFSDIYSRISGFMAEYGIAMTVAGRIEIFVTNGIQLSEIPLWARVGFKQACYGAFWYSSPWKGFYGCMRLIRRYKGRGIWGESHSNSIYYVR